MVVLLIGGTDCTTGIPFGHHTSVRTGSHDSCISPVSNHSEVFAKEDCHFAARDFVSSQGLKPQDYFVYFKASITQD